MKIAFTTKGINWDSKMDPRFGRTSYFVIYDEQSKELVSIDNTDSGNEAHGAGPKTAQRLAEYKADVLITGNGPGGNAEAVLDKAGVICYIGAGDMTVEEAFKAYNEGGLRKI